MSNTLNSIYHLPAAEVKSGKYVLIRGKPCKVRSVHHVIFSTPVLINYGHRTVEIRGTNMLTRKDYNWIGYGYERLTLFSPSSDKLLFITLTDKSAVGINNDNKIVSIRLDKDDPLRSIISNEKWSGDLHILKVPAIIQQEFKEIAVLEKVIPWI